MPTPTTSFTNLIPEIEGAVMEFDLRASQAGFIAPLVFPVFESQAASGSIARIPVESLLQDRETLRASSGGYSRSNYQFERMSFATEEYGAEELVSEREKLMYARLFDLGVVAADRASDAVLRGMERRVAAAVFNSTTFTGALTTAVTNEWDDAANATPIADVEAAMQAVYNTSGLIANALIVGWKVFRNLRNVDEIVDRVKYSGHTDPRGGNISTADLAAVFGVEQVIVGGAPRNTADQGLSASVSSIWDDEYAMVCRVARSNDIQEPAIGRIIHWSADGSNIAAAIDNYWSDEVRSEVIRARISVDERVIYPEAGHLLSNITT